MTSESFPLRGGDGREVAEREAALMQRRFLLHRGLDGEADLGAVNATRLRAERLAAFGGVCPTPCEAVDEAQLWSGFGASDSPERWLGHGFAWRSRPAGSTAPLENAAGNAANDFDVLEGGFCRLRRASPVLVDYALLRRDFAAHLEGRSDAEVDAWLVAQTGFLSAGQVRRLSPGGDLCALLGLQEPGALEAVVEPAGDKMGIRMRSGGRAATFLVGDAYAFTPELAADFIEVKGVGTHADADVSSPKVTGLLNAADALREMAMQRLVQRLAELEGAADEVETVRFYAVIDTGLAFAGTNPATGWEGERCVLAVRQRQSRFLPGYDAMNFSGLVPDDCHRGGRGREMRRILLKYGVSAEFEPRALRRASAESDGVTEEAALDDLEGVWNLQADAELRRFMDHSDYYVLPRSPLPQWWRMSERALACAYALERPSVSRAALANPALSRRLPADLLALRRELSADPAIVRAAAGGLDAEGVVVPLKPKFCMCWFMELDDSEVARWASSWAGGRLRLEELDAQLPQVSVEY